MKRILSFILTSALLLSTALSVKEGGEIPVIVDRTPVEWTDAAPFIDESFPPEPEMEEIEQS